MKIGIIIDIIIISIVGLSIFIGYKKGLTKSFLKIFNFFIALVLSIILFRPVSILITSHTQIDETIQNSIVSSFNEKDEGNEKKEGTGLPLIFSNYIEDTVKTKVDETKEIIVKEASMQIAIIIINTAVAIILFIVIRIILIFIKGIAELVTKIPVIKQCDELCGGIYGALRASIIIYIIFTVLSLIGPLIEGTTVAIVINQSIIGSFLYNNNIIFSIFF